MTITLPVPRLAVPVETVFTVLSLSDFHEDYLYLRQLLSQGRWRLREARSFREALAALRQNPVAVLVSECDLPDATWQDVWRSLELQPNPPAMIVTSRFADDRLWSEVLNLGGYDVLAKPFAPDEVRRVVSMAAWDWQRQQCRIR